MSFHTSETNGLSCRAYVKERYCPYWDTTRCWCAVLFSAEGRRLADGQSAMFHWLRSR